MSGLRGPAELLGQPDIVLGAEGDQGVFAQGLDRVQQMEEVGGGALTGALQQAYRVAAVPSSESLADRHRVVARSVVADAQGPVRVLLRCDGVELRADVGGALVARQQYVDTGWWQVVHGAQCGVTRLCGSSDPARRPGCRPASWPDACSLPDPRQRPHPPPA